MKTLNDNKTSPAIPGCAPTAGSPSSVTLGEAESAISLSKRIMQEEMDQYLYGHKKLTESGMLKEANESLRKGLARKGALKTLVRMLVEVKAKAAPKNSPAFIQENV